MTADDLTTRVETALGGLEAAGHHVGRRLLRPLPAVVTP